MDEVFNNPQRETRNMKIEDDVLTMEFDVLSLSKKDINVKVEDTVLSIEGDNEKEHSIKDTTFKKIGMYQKQQPL